MKNKIIVMLLALSIIVSYATAAVVFTDDMDTTATWSVGSNATNEAGDTTGGVRTSTAGDGTAFQMNSWWDGAGWTNIWRSTGVTMESGMGYNLNVRMVSYASGKPVTLAMSQIDGGGTWTNLVSEDVNIIAGSFNVFTAQLSTIVNPSAADKTLGIGVNPGWWNNLAIDLVTVESVALAGPAYDPDPLPGTEDVGTEAGGNINVQLSWKAGIDPCDVNQVNPLITSHMLYIAPNSIPFDANFTSVTPINIPAGGPPPDANLTYLATGLDFNQLYYWKVDEVLGGDPCHITGEVWSFTTKGAYPEISIQPVDLLIKDGDNATFTVGVISATPAHYSWKKSTDAIVGGDPSVGTDSNTLTITAADITNDDAWYYVVVTNDGSAGFDTSDMAHLWFEREIGRWRMNNSLASDITTPAGKFDADWDASITPSPNSGDFDPCAIEGAASLKFQHDPNDFASVPNSEGYFNNYVVGLTASCWVNTLGPKSGWYAIMTKAARTTGPWQGWTMEHNGGIAYFRVRNVVDFGNANNPQIDDGKWHMLTGVYDPNAGAARFYIDGLQVGNTTSINPANAEKTPLDRLGFGTADTNDLSPQISPFDGLMDDIRIFTYPMTSEEVAAMYVEHVTDATICIDSWTAQYDLEADCQIDFKDLAILAGNWLECHLYPVSRCNE